MLNEDVKECRDRQQWTIGWLGFYQPFPASFFRHCGTLKVQHDPRPA
jgi:hypothetical protein